MHHRKGSPLLHWRTSAGETCLGLCHHRFIFTIVLHSARSPVLPFAYSTLITQSFRALLAPCIHLNLGLSRHLPVTSALHTLFAILSSLILSKWPTNLELCFPPFLQSSLEYQLCHALSFLIRSRLVTPTIPLIQFISNTFILYSRFCT